jgi:hypothetical protein
MTHDDVSGAVAIQGSFKAGSHWNGREGFFSSSLTMFCLFFFLSVVSMSFFHPVTSPPS